MDTTISATTRDAGSKGAARKVRRAGRLPAIVYGPENEPLPISVEPKALVDLFRHTRNRNTIVKLDIEGKEQPALVREVQRHPVSRDILHVDFYRVSPDRQVEVMVPVESVGRPAGAIMGGRLRIIRRTIRVRCGYQDIPEKFVVDVSSMHVGDMVKASEIPTPDGVEMVYDHDFNVMTVYGKKQKTKQQLADEAADEAIAEAAAAESAEEAAEEEGEES
jgi:large subunit ribosomal protein L25